MSTSLNSAKDGELLRFFRKSGDQNAFTTLTLRHERMVFGVARSVVKDAGLAEDIVQASFLTMLKKSDDLEESASVGAWLHRVAVCLARNERVRIMRRGQRDKKALLTAAESGDHCSVPEDVLYALHECYVPDYLNGVVSDNLIAFG